MAAPTVATATSAVLVAHATAFSTASRCSSLPSLPPRFSLKSIKFVSSEPGRYSPLKTRASSSDEPSATIEANELISDLKEKWDAVENKSTVLLYGGGAIVAVWLSSIVVSAINSVPLVSGFGWMMGAFLLPKVMELVGLGYTGWFVYRYLLFKQSRKELASDIESLKKKIAGTE